VGLELYLDMLEGAEGGRGPNPGEEPSPTYRKHPASFRTTIFQTIPRTAYHKRLSYITTEEGIKEITGELRDRFGEIPAPASSLIEVIRLKILMKKLGIEKADIGQKRAALVFAGKSDLYRRFSPAGKLEVYFEKPDPLGETRKVLEKLRGPGTGEKKRDEMIKGR
jgi:transcription-repair coupling factor (superfamily II helicase)